MRLFAALLPLLLLAGGPVAAFDCTTPGPVWSETSPPVNLSHLFCGEVNRRGEAVGYHATLGRRSEGEARIARLLQPPDDKGIYVALACRDEARARRCKRSTFFPDSLDAEAVLAAVLQAYHGRERLDGRGKWCGPTDFGFAVEGWLLPGREAVNTAWPVPGGC